MKLILTSLLIAVCITACGSDEAAEACELRALVASSQDPMMRRDAPGDIDLGDEEPPPEYSVYYCCGSQVVAQCFEEQPEGASFQVGEYYCQE